MQHLEQKRLICGLIQLKPYHKKAVIAMGNFDGVHRGHQVLLKKARAIADHIQRPLLTIIFEPQPKEYQNPNHPPARLYNLREKYLALRAANVDYVLCLRFHRALCEQTAQKFIEQVLCGALQMRHIVLGEGQRFGYRCQGDVQQLHAYKKKHAFDITEVHPCFEQKQCISSTTIRLLLQKNALEQAKKYLGRPYSMIGRVIYGDGMASKRFHTPTANIHPKRTKLPIRGVYLVRVHLQSDAQTKHPSYWGIANIGDRPTRTDRPSPRLEVHLFHFKGNLYQKWLTVTFIETLRHEKKFDSLEALEKQIQFDLIKAKTLAKKYETGFLN